MRVLGTNHLHSKPSSDDAGRLLVRAALKSESYLFERY